MQEQPTYICLSRHLAGTTCSTSAFPSQLFSSLTPLAHNPKLPRLVCSFEGCILRLPAGRVSRGEEPRHVKQGCVVHEDDERVWIRLERLERVELGEVPEEILDHRRDGLAERRGAEGPEFR